MADIQLDYAVPAADLTEYITLFYHFRADVPLFEDTERADHAQFRFRLSPGGSDYRFPDGTLQEATDIHIIGPTSGAMRVRCEGPVLVLGMGVTASGWAALVGNDASSMLNRVIDATGLFGGPRLRAAANALRDAPDIPARVAIAEELIRELVRGCDRSATAFVRHVDTWLAASPSPEMEDLVAATKLSRRQVERKCKALYGAPPKLLARKYRALRAAVALVSESQSVDDLIARGFYDQSHLIREVKQFTGYTPRQIKAEPSLLSQLTISQRVALGGQVSPLISDT
ncbi:MAG: helix-turn-helix domain-containing protein [Pseudomonadota bacterium]|uniref:Transcriptional regulator, AraC family n=1 Tax=hydrothermal vent metagenome TaxID=652676 RepID=A0A160TQV3_9ZZZZ